ncbi:MAG TPA: hypothetical protein VM553_20040 [Dongiaceae bacterium]|nr:hypothetical protein [Dongiaceae bacterium]
MNSIDARIEQAQTLWHAGSEAEKRGEWQKAYELYTEAHDLIVDCAKLHRQAHEKLRRVNWKLGNYTELATDWLLHLFAPVGVFEAVSYFAKTEAFSAKVCKQRT